MLQEILYEVKQPTSLCEFYIDKKKVRVPSERARPSAYVNFSSGRLTLDTRIQDTEKSTENFVHEVVSELLHQGQHFLKIKIELDVHNLIKQIMEESRCSATRL